MKDVSPMAGSDDRSQKRAAPEAPSAAKTTSADDVAMSEPDQALSGEDGTIQNAVKTSNEQDSADRKKIYSGYAQLVVDSTKDSKNEITAIADGTGGYVESVYENTIVIRIPAARFDEIFESILALGKVARKSIETFDVTEFYADLQTRLIIAQKTRERLYALLDRTTDVEERVKILREIRRLSEEIERIKITFDLLENQIAYSRITVDLVSRFDEESYAQGKIPFSWMAGLNPLYASVEKYRGGYKPALGDEFALFAKEKVFRAESAEGVRVRLGTVNNDPEGDSVFWQKALAHYSGPLYTSAKETDLGNFKAVIFTSKDREPYVYLVGVQSSGRDLQIAEVFFPTVDIYTRGAAAIMDAFSQGKRE